MAVIPTSAQPIKIAILAMGGEGGGVACHPAAAGAVVPVEPSVVCGGQFGRRLAEIGGKIARGFLEARSDAVEHHFAADLAEQHQGADEPEQTSAADNPFEQDVGERFKRHDTRGA